MKKKLIACIVLVMFCLSLFNVSFAVDVTVSNPGFEEPVVNGIIPGWTQTFGTTGFSVTDAVKYGGNYSLKLVDNTTTSSIGLESSKINATAGFTYEATAMTYIASGSLLMYIRFWDSSSRLLTSTLVSKNTPVNQWTYITAKGIAPAGTAKISFLLYSGMGATATVYIDNISVTASLIKFTNLGTQIKNPNTLGAAFGQEPDGNVVLYTVISGAPAKFAVVDIKTEAVIKLLDLPGAAGAWTVTVASNGAVYAGTYTNGHLYKYIPGSNSITDLGQAVPGDTYIWDLKPGLNGEVYGGTYIGGNVFKYDPSVGFTRLGGQVEPGEQYIRSVEYDPSTNILYAGVGAHAHLIKYDLNTGAKVNILPSEYAGEQFVYDMSIVNGKLFAWLMPSLKMLVIDIATDAVEYMVPSVTSLGISPIKHPWNENKLEFEESAIPDEDVENDDNNKVYYTSNGVLYYYDISARTTVSLGVDLTTSAREFTFVKLKEPDYPGYTLVGLGNLGKFFKYNLPKGNLKVSNLPLPGQPSQIQNIKKGPDGKIYSSGYLAGGTGVYTPLNGSAVEYKGVGQAEAITTLGSKVYFGVYGGAEIIEYDTAAAWNTSNNNPKKLFDLKEYEQDRPFGMLGVNTENKLFIGTVPTYGKLGGTFSIYDVTTGNLQVNRNIIQDQSVVSLTYKDGMVYGGTSVWGGLGITPTETEAKIFVWDVASGSKVFDMVPVAGKKAITALIEGPDGKIWGMAEGNLFKFDPVTRTITYNTQIYPIDYSKLDHAWRDAFLEIGKDGNIYGVAGGQLFKVNPVTMGVTTIRSNAYLLTQDDAGNMYFVDTVVNSTLWRYEY